jgi:2-dehydro-3-deoxyglucarate aldolase/4-hydroxy-2-oxoheptanedioate aldolase
MIGHGGHRLRRCTLGQSRGQGPQGRSGVVPILSRKQARFNMKPSIRQRLASGQSVRVMALGALAHPKLVEAVAHYGLLHGIWIDQEHSAISHERLETIVMASRAAGLDAFARVPPTDYATVMRPMEAGCSGVMAAQIRTVQQVQQVVQWAKYPPRGSRGLFLSNAEGSYGLLTDAPQYIADANASRWIAIQIETPEAVEAVEEIAANDGVDHLFVGPGDLACTLGVPGDVLHEKCLRALERVSQAAARHGKSWGILSRKWEHARFCREMGCQLFSVFGDMDLVHRGMAHTMAEFQPLLEDD